MMTTESIPAVQAHVARSTSRGARSADSKSYQHQPEGPGHLSHSHSQQQSQTSSSSSRPPHHQHHPSNSNTTNHQHSSSTRDSRPIQDVLPHNDYETSHLASAAASGHRDRPTRTTSRDRDRERDRRDRPPQLPSRSKSSAQAPHPDYSPRQHRRSSSRSSSQYNPPPASNTHSRSHSASRRQNPPDMPSAQNGDRSAQADGHSSNQKQGRSRSIIPTQSGKWILGKTIGAGSMGKVKLARKEESGEQVACKIIPRGSTDDNHLSRADKERADYSKEVRTSREAAIVTLLNHPHICGLRDVVRTNYHWYMLFEFVNGGQMLDYIISHGKLKEKQARKFSRQIASALDYCHRNSIVHRDLKIENILISKNGDIKIIDFGLSNLFAPRGHLKTFCGSLYFAAPELLQAKAYTGPEVDVWSFGIVLYVLVCGKVPFDDQSMPALHAKIKKGVVDYPSWLTSECKHLISRMLVTDPKQRASMQEVMTHPWMVKGFNGPPDNYMAAREPLLAPLEPDVIQAMQGFNFGSPESIKTQLLSIIESDEYKRAIRMYQREREAPPTPKDEKKRGVLDFYKRRNSQHSRDTLTGPSSEALQIGNDPLNAFSPLLSIYYLVKEKHDRDQKDVIPPPTGPAINREKEKEREKDKEQGREHREGRREKEPEAMPELVPPQAAHTNAAAYEMPGEKPTGGRTRPRARTHGEDEAPENVKGGHLAPPEPKSEKEKEKEKRSGGAAGLLRRFSTRRQKKEPEREKEKDRSHPPVVQVQAPAPESAQGSRRSFSIRRSRRDEEAAGPSIRFGGSQPGHRELLSPPMSAGGSRDSRRSGALGRSTSVNSADVRRHQSTRLAKDPPPTSGSEQSVSADQSGPPRPGHGHSKSVNMRAKSLGHARRESIQQRRQRREEAREANVPEETDMEAEQSMPSSERLDDSELAKPVFLKGLFSVSTTSGKSVPAIRADIRRVLRQLNVEYTEIKGGFTCKHSPSIDLNRVQDPPLSPGQTPQHRRRFSFGGLRRGEDDARDPDQPPRTPRTPGRSDRDRSYSNSETSVDSIPRRTNGGSSRRAPGETSTHVTSDLGSNMVLEFEIFIVKVPLLSMHGIQFKRMTGNTWQYKSMADQILKELRL